MGAGHAFGNLAGEGREVHQQDVDLLEHVEEAVVGSAAGGILVHLPDDPPGVERHQVADRRGQARQLGDRRAQRAGGPSSNADFGSCFSIAGSCERISSTT